MLVPEARWLTVRYEFLQELGRGGMGIVYLARDLAFDRLVAIKVLGRAHPDDEDAGLRFAHEANTVAALDHPNIVRTLAIEELDGTAVAIVNEFVPGRTLHSMLRELGPLPFEQATSLLRDIASGLAYAHRLRIVHRDVKPENIFVEGKSGRALLADFGIARTLDNDVRLTTAGATFGTPSYMSPEQITGQHVDERVDVYALGLIGWEMLAGSRPWEGETLYAVLHNQQYERLPSLAELRPDIPMFLLSAIEGALGKLPALRWRDGGEMLARLSPRPTALPPRRDAEDVSENSNRETQRIDAVAVTEDSASAPVESDAPRSIPVPRRVSRLRLSARLAALGLLAMIAGVERQPPSNPVTPLAAAGTPLAVAAGAMVETPQTGTRSGDVALHDSLRGGAPNVPAVAHGEAQPVAPAAPPPPPPTRSAEKESAGSLARSRTRVESPASPRVRGRPKAVSPKVTPKKAVPKRPSSTRAAKSAAWRCGSSEVEDQRACLLAHIDRNDVPMSQSYQALVRQLRRNAGGRANARALVTLRAEQRTWAADRERRCRALAPETNGTLWGVQRMPCFWQLSRERDAELRRRLVAGRSLPR